MLESEVAKILDELERAGMIFKTWDVKKQDYVWHKTEFGRRMAKELNWEQLSKDLQLQHSNRKEEE